MMNEDTEYAINASKTAARELGIGLESDGALTLLAMSSGHATMLARALSRTALALALLALLAAACSTVPPPTTPATLPRPLNIEEARANNYDPQVTMRNIVLLGKARLAPFATYIVAIHDRIHPIFEEELKAAREAYPDLGSAGDLVATVELVLAHEDGRPVLLGIVKSSGSVIFDAVALAAMRRAAPFGAPPPSIVSQDGKVYVHWDLHTDPTEACSSRGARPYIVVRLP